jgi:crotonobetainyl-CoA:carnitine CoA-transferase CaiB-like acyl-CoA transferase
VVKDPQVREMGWITKIEHPTASDFETLGTPFQIRGAGLGPQGPAPGIGEHTQAVLGELGLDEEAIANLAAEGVFG